MSVQYERFLFDMESNMRIVTESAYAEAIKSSWWFRVARTMQTSSRSERISWLLETGRIKESEGNGQVRFEDLVAQSQEVTAKLHTAGLEITKEQVDDFARGAFGGEALLRASDWSTAMGAQAALYPQELLSKALLANGTGYDGVAFFATNHPLNPFRPELGNYSNLITGATYAIHHAVATTAETKAVNFAKALALVSNIKTPNGATSRNLKVVGLLHPPALMNEAAIVTGAKFVNATDVEGYISNNGIEPISAPELGAAYGGSDIAYYLITRDLGSQIGPFIHADREPFSVAYHGPEASPELTRRRMLQYVMAGRTAIEYGHPYGLIKVTAA